MVLTRLTPVKMAENPVRRRATIHRSGPAPGVLMEFESGAYATQPKSAADPVVRNPIIIREPPPRYSQYDNALSLGNAMSGAPICSGTM